jgi:hypothetical protein
MESGQFRPALRLLRTQLPEVARGRRRPVAVHRRRTAGHRAALRRRGVPHRRRHVRELRARPGHRRPGQPGRLPRAAHRGPRHPQGAQGLTSTRTGPAGLQRDLLDLYQLGNLVDVTWALVAQAACATRDRELLHIVDDCSTRTAAQLDWVRIRMRTAVPPTVVAATWITPTSRRAGHSQRRCSCSSNR